MYKILDELVLLILLNLKDMTDEDIDSIIQAGQTELMERAYLNVEEDVERREEILKLYGPKV